MATQLNEILHEPPLLHPMVIKDENEEAKIHPAWQNYFTNQRSAFSQFFPTVTQQTANGINHSLVPKLSLYSQADRDLIQSPQNGLLIINTTTGKLNFYFNTWVAVP